MDELVAVPTIGLWVKLECGHIQVLLPGEEAMTHISCDACPLPGGTLGEMFAIRRVVIRSAP